MNISEFQQSYHKFLVFGMDAIRIKDLIFHSRLSINQIDLLLSAIGIVFTRLSMIKKLLEERKSDLNAKKNESTLF